MFPALSSFSLVLVVVLTITEICQADSHWNYIHQDHWPLLCQTGQMQSPINLHVATSMFMTFEKFVFEGYRQTTSAVMQNNGHSAQIVLRGIVPPRMHGGGLPNELYELDHLHFHWESEHTINHHRYPLELHMVHFSKESGSLSEALKRPGHVAVLGVLFEISPDDDDDFAPLVEILSVLKKYPVSHVQTLSNFSAKNFMPQDLAGFFRYQGSLTTPGCTEGVEWTVFTNTLRISKQQVKEFEFLKTPSNDSLSFNYRKLQAVNKRTVYLKESPIGRFASSGAIGRQNISTVFTIITLILALFCNSGLFSV